MISDDSDFTLHEVLSDAALEELAQSFRDLLRAPVSIAGIARGERPRTNGKTDSQGIVNVTLEYDHRPLAMASVGPCETPPSETTLKHMALVFDLLVFAGHRALSASRMHVASLEEKDRLHREVARRLDETERERLELSRAQGLLANVLVDRVLSEFSARKIDIPDLASTMRSFAELAQLESGSTQFELRELDLRTVLRVFPDAFPNVEVNVLDDLPPVLADSSQLERALFGLLQTMGRGRLTVRTVSESSDAEMAAVLFAPIRSAVEFILEPAEAMSIAPPGETLVQTIERGKANLSLAQRIIEAHQGVFVASPRAIVVRLPAADNAMLPPVPRMSLPALFR